MSRRAFDWRRAYEQQFAPLPSCMGGPRPETAAEAVPAEPEPERAVTADVASPEPETKLKTDPSPDTTMPDTKPPTRAVRHSPQWPEDRLESLRKLVAEGLSFREIAARLEMTLGAIAGKCHRLGLRTGRGRNRPPGEPGPGKGVPRRRAPGKRPPPEITAGSSSAAADRAPEPVQTKDGFWTDDRIARIREVAGSGGSKATAAHLLGVTKTRIAYQAQKHGIKFPSGSQTASDSFAPGTKSGYRPSGITLRATVGKGTPAAKPKALAPSPETTPADELTAEEMKRLARYVERGLGLTAIAATMGKPYRVVIANMEALGLSRVAA